MKKAIFVCLFVLGFISFQTSAKSQTTILPSGKKIEILALGKIFFTKDTPALSLRYKTDINIENVDLLRKEAEEIWPVFRFDVEKSGLDNAVIIASAQSVKKFLVIKKTKNYNFPLSKKVNRTWKFISWGRDYDKEGKGIADNFLNNCQDIKTLNAVNLLHIPYNYSKTEIDNERQGLIKVAEVIFSKLGKIKSYKINNSSTIYHYFALQSATPQYWEEHPFFNALIYDVEFSKAGKGHIVFKFSIIDSKLKINVILFCIPTDNQESEQIIQNVVESVMKKLKVT
jgi:hypothetical protein